MKKRLLSTLLTLCMALSLLPATALAADTDLSIKDGVLMRYQGFDNAVTIPDGVTTIGRSAFEGRFISSVTIPSSVTSIEERAFKDCKALESITIPDGVTVIEPSTFLNCRGLTSVTIPDSVTSIGRRAFDGCINLTSITIPNGVTSIESSMFSGCESLKSVTIPSSVANVAIYAFLGCDSLTDVYYGGSESQWKQVAIEPSSGGNDPLLNATIHYSDGGTGAGSTASGSKSYPCGDNLTYSSRDGVFIIEGTGPMWNMLGVGDGSLFWAGSSTPTIIISQGVTSIGSYAFYDCRSLTSVTIPASVTSIGGSAFTGCASLSDVYYGGSESEWKQLVADVRDNELLNATIHYSGASGGAGGTAPAEPEQSSAPASGTAYASTQTVELDGKKVEFQMYALKEANGGLTNYIKVRDLAFALNGTKAQFSVDWDGQVNLVAGEAYTPNGSENSTPFKGDRAYTVPTSPTNVNGEASDLSAIVLTDDNGGGYNYYKLRDLGSKLGFNVDWTAERGVFIETGKPYGG